MEVRWRAAGDEPVGQLYCFDLARSEGSEVLPLIWSVEEVVGVEKEADPPGSHMLDHFDGGPQITHDRYPFDRDELHCHLERGVGEALVQPPRRFLVVVDGRAVPRDGEDRVATERIAHLEDVVDIRRQLVVLVGWGETD